MADNIEVSGLGLVGERRDENGDLTGCFVSQVFLPGQVNGLLPYRAW